MSRNFAFNTDFSKINSLPSKSKITNIALKNHKYIEEEDLSLKTESEDELPAWC